MYHYNLSQKFSSIVQNYPGHIALKFPDGETVSYLELDRLSNKLSFLIRSKGINPGDVIAIFNEKSIHGYAIMLACLKTGVIYTNLDGSSPWNRLEKIISICSPRAVFYDTNSAQIFSEIETSFPEIQITHLGEIDYASCPKENGDYLDQNFHGGNPAYIMFTSGSTGFPKGAVMSHQNVLNFINWGKETFSVTTEDIFTNANPIYFDNSVFDFYVSLFNGSTLVPLSHELAKNPKKLVEAINRSACSIWFSVPSLLVYLLTTKALKSEDFTSVTRISFGGEGFPKNKLKQLFELFGKRIQLFNVYGPTECTCICSSYVIGEVDFENMTELAPLGKLSPNFGYKIINDENGSSKIGELCLTGPCVGLGYYNEPERTSVSFLQNPNKPFKQLMYKTGDLVEMKENGDFHFKGRVDNQIKHMGYRIELEEIEAAINSISFVNECGVVYEKINESLGQILAFIQINFAPSDDTVDSILNEIKTILPSYMIPRKIKLLPELPKNKNGKIDRKQLQALL